METVSFNRTDFKKFLGCLELISKTNCTDCDISKGIIRQKTNDRHGIIEMNLESLIGQRDITLALVKSKFDLLSSFQLDNNVKVDNENVDIEISEKHYKFMDHFSKLSFVIPVKQLLDNAFIPDEEFNGMFQLNDTNILFSGEIISYVSKRIKNICIGLSVDSLVCNMTETEAKLSLTTTSKESFTDLNKSFSLNRNMKDSYFILTALPFMLEVESDVRIDVYKHIEDRLICKFSLMYEGIPLTIYSQAQIGSIKNEE